MNSCTLLIIIINMHYTYPFSGSIFRIFYHHSPHFHFQIHNHHHRDCLNFCHQSCHHLSWDHSWTAVVRCNCQNHCSFHFHHNYLKQMQIYKATFVQHLGHEACLIMTSNVNVNCNCLKKFKIELQALCMLPLLTMHK